MEGTSETPIGNDAATSLGNHVSTTMSSVVFESQYIGSIFVRLILSMTESFVRGLRGTNTSVFLP